MIDQIYVYATNARDTFFIISECNETSIDFCPGYLLNSFCIHLWYKKTQISVVRIYICMIKYCKIICQNVSRFLYLNLSQYELINPTCMTNYA
jgi:hypothetical protein